MNLGLETLRNANLDRSMEWDPDSKLDLSFAVIELCGETGELANKVKKLLRFDLGLTGGVHDIDGITEEIGDVLICLDRVASALNIDLSKAVVDKLNATSDKCRRRESRQQQGGHPQVQGRQHGFDTRLEVANG